MFEDGDRDLTIIGVVLVGLLLSAIGVAVLAAMAGPSAAEPPNAEWRLERVNESHVRITHAGGERVPASDLVVTVEGYERDVTWSGMVTEGDATVVQATEDRGIHLYWNGGRGDRVSIAVWRV